MESLSIPVIILCSYMLGEIYKIIFKNKEELYKLIPILVSIFGGILGIIIYLTTPEMIKNATNIWIALEIGVISGASSTTANQIIKKTFIKNKEENL